MLITILHFIRYILVYIHVDTYLFFYFRLCIFLTLQKVMHISDMAVMTESYRKPFPVYLVVNEYTVPSANDDRVLIPGDRDDSNDSNTSKTETDVS